MSHIVRGSAPAAGGGGGAPTDATYVTLDANGSLSAEAVLGADVVMSGTLAARPAAAKAGKLYFATDNGILYRDTGAAWVQVGAERLAALTARAHSDLTGIGADDHHAQGHTLASHSTKAHSELTGVGADDHHAKQHAMDDAANHTSTDLTALDVTTAKHGFAPKAPNDTTKFLRGDATWAAPAGGGAGMAADALWDAAGDLAQGTGADTGAKLTMPSANFIHSLGRVSSSGLGWLQEVAFKPSDEIVAASTTLQDDNDLFLPIGSGSELWWFRLILLINAPNNAMDVKLGWTVPAGTTMSWGAMANGTFLVVSTASAPTAVITAAGTSTSGSFNGTWLAEFGGVIVGAGTAGNVQLQWAQNTSDAGNLTFMKGSVLLAKRLV